MVVTPVEHIGEGPIPGLVLTHICIEQIHGNDMPGVTRYAIPPGPDTDSPTFDIDSGLLVEHGDCYRFSHPQVRQSSRRLSRISHHRCGACHVG
jgi:hypothetical protein